MVHGTRSLYVHGGCRCEDCCAAQRRYSRERRELAGRSTTHPITDVQPLARELVLRYGSPVKAGRAYDERYGYRNGNGYRLMCRILYGETQAITSYTLDKLRTLVAS